jgi:hypothetical protein
LIRQFWLKIEKILLIRARSPLAAVNSLIRMGYLATWRSWLSDRVAAHSFDINNVPNTYYLFLQSNVLDDTDSQFRSSVRLTTGVDL